MTGNFPKLQTALRIYIGAFLFALVFITPGRTFAEAPVSKVVYHIDDSASAIPAIRNIGNHLKAAPETRIVVVALGDGISFLVADAKDERGNPFEPMIDDLILSGVDFRVCHNTMLARSIAAQDLHPEVTVVPSGVAEITRLQIEEAYAYLKP